VDDHQTSNARFLSDNAAAILLQQSELSVENLVALMKDFVDNRTRLAEMGAAARACAKPEALQQVTDLVVKTAYTK
jgi:UDP-N-acetylglucosamine--N-acetylmuramyl-(pentapeptide) pyrophosphoryl-undecaprenol N-acetylglucosamine transferase